MAKFNLNNLFRSKGMETKYSVSKLREGATGPSSTISIYSTPSRNGDPKLQKIAFGAERLFESAVLQSSGVSLKPSGDEEDFVYVEYTNSSSERVAVTFNGESLIATQEEISNTAIAKAIVAYLVRSNSDLEETKEVFDLMTSEFYSKGKITDDLYFKLCDSVYFGWMKDKVQIEVTAGLKLPEVQMNINNGGLTPLFDREDEFVLVDFSSEKRSSGTSLNFSAQYETMWEEMKAGEWALPYEWDEESMAYIPPLNALTKYHPTSTFFEVASQLRDSYLKTAEKLEAGVTLKQELMEDIINAVLTGEPGTGKTILLYSLASALQVPCYTIALDSKTEGDEFKGMIKVDGETGNLHFEYTDFLRGFTKGGIVILEEINLLDPNLAQGVLGQALESPYVIFKDGNQKVYRHPLCAIYSTMNVGTTGSMNLNQAFASRSPSVYVLDSVTKNDFVRALVAKFGERFTIKQGEWAFKVWETTQEYLKQDTVQADDIALAVSQRSCYELLKQIQLTGDAKRAIRNTIFGTVFLYDPQIATQLMSAINVAVGEFPTA
jgi:hypothetical protein